MAKLNICINCKRYNKAESKSLIYGKCDIKGYRVDPSSTCKFFEEKEEAVVSNDYANLAARVEALEAVVKLLIK